MNFAENMKTRREALKLTQVALSVRSGVPQQTISAVEQGRRIPNAETMMMIAKGLRCSVDSLLYGEEQKEKPADLLSGLDEELVTLLVNLPKKDVQRVKDFVQGMKASRGE